MINDAVFNVAGGPSPRGGKWIDGKETVLEMKKAGFGSWREMEWGGYYIKFLIKNTIESGFLGGFQSIVDQKHYLAKGEYLWDARLMDADNSALILADQDRMEQLISDHEGLGIVIFQAVYEMDKTGKFKDWHQNEGGGVTQYVLDRIARGAPSRMRKSAFMITHSFSFYFTRHDIDQGINQGWLTTVAQDMRNADGTLRNPKYMLHLDQAPPDKLLGVRNFNWDKDEFDQAFAGLNPL